ncbi:MAG TPA: PASTA domain-containing protein [Gemmatimonadaceae bacterium]|nr:PASTA domain-containing protein [Gemmatimonadaceae bacterium]
MTWRGQLRRSLPYIIALVSGFLVAFLVVAFFVFPSGVIPQEVRVPNVVGLTYSDAARQLSQDGFNAERGETRFHNAAPRGTVLDQTPAPGSREAPNTRIVLVVSGGQRYGTIPSIVGMSRELAMNALETAGFDVGTVTERPSNEPRGAVIDSRPRPGVQAPMPSSVALVLSAGPTTVIVPDVVGRPLTDARQLLRQVGLNAGDVQFSAASITDAAAVVVSQSPPAGAQAASGSRVNLTVGSRTSP